MCRLCLKHPSLVSALLTLSLSQGGGRVRGRDDEHGQDGGDGHARTTAPRSRHQQGHHPLTFLKTPLKKKIHPFRSALCALSSPFVVVIVIYVAPQTSPYQVDRLILELKLPPNDAYYKLAHTIEEVTLSFYLLFENFKK